MEAGGAMLEWYVHQPTSGAQGYVGIRLTLDCIGSLTLPLSLSLILPLSSSRGCDDETETKAKCSHHHIPGLEQLVIYLPLLRRAAFGLLARDKGGVPRSGCGDGQHRFPIAPSATGSGPNSLRAPGAAATVWRRWRRREAGRQRRETARRHRRHAPRQKSLPLPPGREVRPIW